MLRPLGSGRRPRFRFWRTLGLALLAVIVVGTVLAYTPAGSLTASVPPPQYGAADPLLPWLMARNGRIIDQAGRTVLLRGFNVDALVSYPKDPPAPLDETDASLMQQAGFNVVRLGIDWAQLEPVRGRIDQRYLDRIEAAVQLLNRHNLYVVLEMHFRLGWSPRFGYSGAPGWAHIPGIPNWNPLPQYTWSPSLSPAAWTADSYFWLASDWQQDFLMTWEAVARRFHNSSGLAGYDLVNEPHPLPIPPRLFEKYWMWPLYQRAIEAVGAVDSNHMFFVEGILLFTLNTVMVHLHAPNLVYGTHIYEGSLVPPMWNGDRTPLQDRFQVREREAGVLGAPLWVGEMGHDLTQAGALGYADTLLDNADDLQIGWAWWQWRENRYWGIRDRDGGALNLEALRHLARPYVAASAPGVHAGRGDGLNGHLNLHVDKHHEAATLSVAWSTLTLHPPNVSGTCVQESHWDAPAARLTIELPPGDGCEVDVSAAS